MIPPIFGAQKNAGRRPLLFPWPERGHLHLLFPTAIIVAAILHTAGILLFSVKYPDTSGGDPHEAKLVILGSDTPVARMYGAWLKSEDPTLFSAGTADPLLPPLQIPATHTPSFDLNPPQLVRADLSPPTPPLETFSPARPVLPAPALHEQAPSPPSPASPTDESPQLRGDLERLDLPKLPRGSPTDTRVSWFLLRVRPDGTPTEVFLVRSSGDAELDASRARRLRLAKAPPSVNSDAPRAAWVSVSAARPIVFPTP